MKSFASTVMLRFTALFLTAVSCLIWGCAPETDKGSFVDPVPDVICVGGYERDDNGYGSTMLWVSADGGETFAKKAFKEDMFKHVAVSGGTVCTVGDISEGQWICGSKLWIGEDGGITFEEKILSDNPYGESLYTISAWGDRIFAGGSSNDGEKQFPLLWKSTNGGKDFSEIRLGKGGVWASVLSVCTSGNHIYAGGYVHAERNDMKNVPMMWISRDGGETFTEKPLNEGRYITCVTSVAVSDNRSYAGDYVYSGNRIYAVGWEQMELTCTRSQVIKLWISENKGGTFSEKILDNYYWWWKPLVASSDHRVYIAGCERNGPHCVANLWISTDRGVTFTKKILGGEDGDVFINSIFAKGLGIYVAGVEYDKSTISAKLWVSRDEGRTFEEKILAEKKRHWRTDTAQNVGVFSVFTLPGNGRHI